MLQHFFDPKSVAVVGASREEGKVGYELLKNIVQYGYAGEVYPINPKATEILGLTCYRDVREVAGEIDLAVIAIPAPFIPPVIDAFGDKGIDSVIVLSAGFKEAGADGVRLEREVAEKAANLGMRILGPNCLGLISTHTRLNASFAKGMPVQGNIAFFSQSGALCSAILDWAMVEGLGFSKFISLGNKMDISEVDLIRALGDDPATDVILGYIEGVRDGEAFMEVGREVSQRKPIVIMKSGSTAAGARAASSHTGALAGSENAFQAAFRQCGVIRAESVEALFNYALGFSYQPLPAGLRLAIVTNAGGPGIIAADAVDRSRLSMASFDRATVERLREGLPPTAAVYNPVDVIGDAGVDRYRLAVEMVAADPNVDAVLVLLTPQAMSQIDETAAMVGEIADRSDKPVMASFMGKLSVASGIRILQEHRVPNYPYPEPAISALEAMAIYGGRRSRPELRLKRFSVRSDLVRKILSDAAAQRQINLGGDEVMEVLAAYGFETPRSGLAETSQDAVGLSEKIGYPVVMKIASPDILHKSDVGGVRVGLQDAAQVRAAFDEMVATARRFSPDAVILGATIQEMIEGGREVILGMAQDPDFGPMLMFGLGGIYVEVLKDTSFRIAPVDEGEADAMMRELRSFLLLQGVRGEEPSDLEAIRGALLRLSQLVTDFPEIVEMDINPLIVRSRYEGAVAIDARIAINV